VSMPYSAHHVVRTRRAHIARRDSSDRFRLLPSPSSALVNFHEPCVVIITRRRILRSLGVSADTAGHGGQERVSAQPPEGRCPQITGLAR
jgi:hypothetical protein